MKKSNSVLFGAMALALVFAYPLSAQTAQGEAQSTPAFTEEQHTPKKPASTLTHSEREGLLFMREEEKLALDAYVVFAEKWGARPFGNIAQAEQSHMDSVKVLLDKYGLPDPIATLKPGQFKNPALQKLYDDLVKSGSTSRIEALKAGAAIEDVDLYDLARWSKLTDKKDILAVFEVLAAGSRNHLRAFVRNLRNSGVTYKPQYITQEAFDKIINSPNERGGSGQGPRA